MTLASTSYESVLLALKVAFLVVLYLFVWRVIESNIHLATEFLAQLPEGVGLDGRPPQCHAHTRKGTPCQRTPLPGRDYCPSHKHLEETFESVEIPVGASEAVDGEVRPQSALTWGTQREYRRWMTSSARAWRQ